MKVGIVTLTGGENYGNVLQNYAVQEVIKEIGHEAETIKNDTKFGAFYPSYQRVNKLSPAYIKLYLFSQLNYRYNIKNSGKGIIKTLLKCRKNSQYLAKARILRKEAFDGFYSKHLSWSNQVLHINKPWTREQEEKYDYYISGSDQVWNPVYPTTSSINFLQFAPEHKRITFSPSFGIETIPDGLKEDYKKWLSEISHLSVREEKGMEIIKELCGREAKVLCDPTMCLTKDKWLSIAQKPQFDTDKPYILTYFLGDRNKKYDKFIEKIAKEQGLKIINLFDVLDLEYYATSPEEFIYLINNAKLVCTDSFHGTVFSIIMHTDFVSFPRIESGKSMNSRMETLLKTFGLEGREYGSVTGENIFGADFTNCDNILLEKRAEAIEFIQNAFQSENKEQAPSVKTLVLENKWDCCGCTACSNVCPVNCITMARDSEGFSYPSIDLEKCIHCKKCENICPAVNMISPKRSVGEKCLVAYSNKPDIRKNSSSGGIFYHLAERVISQGGVVFGVCIENGKAKHSFAQTLEELGKFKGSKYVQSDIGESFKKAKELLDSGVKVLFSGTPCQIKGLYAFLGDKIYPELITQDLICHGVPSPKVFEEYLAFKSSSDKPSVSFRDKKYGWHYFSMRISDEKRSYRKTLEDDWYLKLFLDNTILRPSCHACKAKEEGSSADITLADCWAPHKVCPEIKDTDEGLSLVLLNSKTGQIFWDELESKGEVFYKVVDSEKALASQSAISHSVKANVKRAMFFDAINKVDIAYLYKNWYKCSPVRKIKGKINFVKMKLRMFLISIKEKI